MGEDGKVMRLSEINIRDPCVLLADGIYYMYGTRAKRCWGEDDGLDCYCSRDLEEWTGPAEVFHKPEGFWADRNYWAPECHIYNGAYYILASFKSAERRRGTQILKADSPLGPFAVHSDGPVTPADWECLDGTLYVAADGKPYMVFCHEWVQIGDGAVCSVPLTEDLRAAAGEPRALFTASQAPWVVPHWNPNHRIEKAYVTDGPFLHRFADGRLFMIWSSFGPDGYAVGTACSKNGEIDGEWLQSAEPLFGKNGGHGMLFAAKDGGLRLALHSPNKTPLERPAFFPLRETAGGLELIE